MATQVQFQTEVGIWPVGRAMNMFFCWFGLAVVEFILFTALSEFLRFKPEGAVILGLSVLLLLPVTYWSWWLTDHRLYLAVRHEPAGATLYTVRFVHGQPKHYSSYPSLQSIELSLGDDGDVFCFAVSASGKKGMLFMDSEPLLNGFVLNKSLRNRVAEALNTRADNRWKSLPTEPAAHNLEAIADLLAPHANQ